jgi:hypothetical protein
MADEWKEATGKAWKPEKEGDQVVGLLIKVESNIGMHNSMMYHLEDSTTHDIIKVWGSTILDSRMSEVKIGKLVRITFKGLAQGSKGKNPPKIFKVEYKDAGSSEIHEPTGEDVPF